MAKTATAETPAFSFEETDIPEVTRATSKAPNPFGGKVAELKANGKAASFVVPGVASAAKDEKGQFTDETLRTVIRQLNDAGAEHGVTVRKTVESVDGKVKLTFWTKARETRKRKDA